MYCNSVLGVDSAILVCIALSICRTIMRNDELSLVAPHAPKLQPDAYAG